MMIGGLSAEKMYRFSAFLSQNTSNVRSRFVRKLERIGLWDFCPGITQAPSGFRLKPFTLNIWMEWNAANFKI